MKKEYSKKAIAFFMFCIALGIVLGLVFLNQIIEFKYKSDVIKDPCGVCVEQNPHLESCLKEFTLFNPIDNLNYKIPKYQDLPFD